MRSSAPSKDEIATLPPFDGLPLARVHVPSTEIEFAAARDAIRRAGTVGFDTESKPLFDVGAVSTGPHVVQFATREAAYIFQVSRSVGLPFLFELFAADDVVKVGFGLASDFKHIDARFGVPLRGVVDLNTTFRAQGFRAAIGVRAAVAICFDRRFLKSKRQTTSNWAAPVLDAKQLLYAANDAYAALCVHLALVPVLEERAERAAAANGT